MGAWRSVLTIRVLEDRTVRIEKTDTTIRLWLSAKDTCFWATRTGNSWPCSQLSGKQLYAEFDDGDLVDALITDSKGVMMGAPLDEFTAITDDFIKEAG